ncbi:MAG: peptidyl-prolyl cis-trans isomerase, EpsD family, partial [Betaproteobacteria bacterium HGW-Betaproteobacteria-21]
EILGPLSKMKEGQVAINRTPTGVSLMLIEAARDEPIDEVRARPFIEQYLTAQARTELARAEIKRLRDIAAIEYVGEFAGKAPTTLANAPAAGNATAPATKAAGVTASEVAPATSSDETLRTALEKGAAGLK